MPQQRTRQGERGQAMLLLAGIMAVLVLVFVLVGDVAVVYTAYQRVAGDAAATARAGVEEGIDLSGYGQPGGTAKINPTVAVAAAQRYFAGLALGAGYQLAVVSATATQLTLSISTTVTVVFWGTVPLNATSTETPQVDV